jgi:hypothetical protein
MALAAMDVKHLEVVEVEPAVAASIVIEHHYLHRRPPMSFAFGLLNGHIEGVATFGVPPSRHLQMSACPSDPDLVLELNRVWIDDTLPRNTGSWFLSRALKRLPPRIIVSYADTRQGHIGYLYRACNFRYAGWTDMERKTPRFDYLPADPNTHTRDAFRNGYVAKVRRKPKVKYWTTTGNRRERRDLASLCGWPSLDWNDLVIPGSASEEPTQ